MRQISILTALPLKILMPLVALVMVLLVLNACAVAPTAPKEVSIKTSEPIATFTTSEAQRSYARDRGLPVLLSGRAAQYPANLDASKFGNGWVLLDIEVLAGGQVGAVNVVQQSDPAFNDAAIEAIQHWRFEPAQESSRFVHRVSIIGASGDHLQRDSTITQ